MYNIQLSTFKWIAEYRKIPKISPSKYNPPKPVTQKALRQIAPPNISPPGACAWKIALKYKVKQSKNGKFTSHYKVCPIDLKMQFRSLDKPLKKSLWKI